MTTVDKSAYPVDMSAHAPWPPFEVSTGDRFRIVRRHMGVKQGELAAQLGVDPATVGFWEVGRHLTSLTPAIARRVEILSGIRGSAAFILDPDGSYTGGPGGGLLPHLDSNQESSVFQPAAA